MVKSENLEVSSEQTISMEEELVELGTASKETQGLLFGSAMEIAILPLRGLGI